MFARLSRHTLILIVSNVGGAGLSFLLSVLIGRFLGQDGLGQYAVVLAWIFPLSMLVEFGLGTLATRDIAQGEHSAGAYLRTMTLARLWLGGAVMVLVYLGAPLLSHDPVVVSGLQISAPMVLILPFYSAFTAVFRARGAMYPIPWLNIGMLLVQVGLTMLVFAFGMGIRAALMVNLATSAGQLAAAWLVYRWRFYTPVIGQPPSMRVLLARAFPFALAALFVTLQMRLSVVMLEQIAGTSAAGQFAAANRFVEAGRMLPNAFFGALLPALAGLAAQPAVLRQTMQRAMLALGGFGAAAALATLPLAGWLISLTYGVDFAPAAPVLQILMLALFFGLLRGGQTLRHYALGHEQSVNIINGIGVCVQIALNLLLIPALGAVGAAAAFAFVELVTFVLLLMAQPGDTLSTAAQ